MTARIHIFENLSAALKRHDELVIYLEATKLLGDLCCDRRGDLLRNRGDFWDYPGLRATTEEPLDCTSQPRVARVPHEPGEPS